VPFAEEELFKDVGRLGRGFETRKRKTTTIDPDEIFEGRNYDVGPHDDALVGGVDRHLDE
jgi:hypothetical protein